MFEKAKQPVAMPASRVGNGLYYSIGAPRKFYDKEYGGQVNEYYLFRKADKLGKRQEESKMRNLSLITAVFFGLAFCVSAQQGHKNSRPQECAPKSVKPLDGTMESEKSRFSIQSPEESAVLKIRVVNCSGAPIGVSARPMVELIRVGKTSATAKSIDWFDGSVDTSYAAPGSSIRLDAGGSHEFEIDLNKMHYMGRMRSISVWDSFLNVIPTGEFNVTGTVRLTNPDENGDVVRAHSSNQVIVERLDETLKK